MNWFTEYTVISKPWNRIKVLEKKLRERTKTTFLEILETEVMAHFIEKMEKEGEWEKIIDDLMNRRTDPYSVAEKIMAEELKNH